MKNMILVVLASFALGACAHPAAEETTQSSVEDVSAESAPPSAAVDARAKALLPEVAHLLGTKPASAYALGEGFDIRYLDRASVRGFDGESTFDALAGSVRDRAYPVLDDGKVVGSLTLHVTDGVWSVRAVGLGDGSGKIGDLRQKLRAARSADGDAYTLVHVTGLGSSFLYHRESGVEYLTDLREETPKVAQAALGELAEHARAAASR